MATCRRFSKAAAAAAQRQVCIVSSAIFSEERGTESGGLWDVGGPHSAALSLSPHPLVLQSPRPETAFLKLPLLLGRAFECFSYTTWNITVISPFCLLDWPGEMQYERLNLNLDKQCLIF